MDSNNNMVVIHDGDNGTEVNTNRDNSTNDDDKQTIYNHSGGKARSQVWKVFGFFKKKDRQGPGTRENLDMTKAVCRLCRKEYTNKGLDEKFLVLHPEDKHCFRLAKLITLEECYRVVTRLGFSEIALNDIQNEDKYDNSDKKGVALYQWRDQKEKDGSKPSFQELFDALAEKKTHHVLCQLFTEDVTDHEIKNSAQEIPDDDCLQDLSKQVGNCAMHLGAELGLSMPAIEGILFKYRKSIIEQALGVMKEWKSSSKVRPTILMLMKAFQLADGRGLVFLRKKYMGSRECSRRKDI